MYKRLTVLLVAMALVMVGCGGGGDSTDVVDPTTSGDEPTSAASSGTSTTSPATEQSDPTGTATLSSQGASPTPTSMAGTASPTELPEVMTQTVSGTGPVLSDAIELRAGLVMFRYTYDGPADQVSSFFVRLLRGDNGEFAADIANELNAGSGAVVAVVDEPLEYVIEVQQATGEWSIEVEQPVLGGAETSTMPISAEGTSSSVVGWVSLDEGLYEAEASYSGQHEWSTLSVVVYSDDGTYQDRAVQGLSSGTEGATSALAIPNSGLYLVTVEAEIGSEWSVGISQRSGSGADGAGATATTEPADSATENDPQLMDAIVSLDDLPSGWSVWVDEDDDDDSDDEGFCGSPPFEGLLESGDDAPKAEAQFQEDDFGPFLWQGIVYVSERDADTIMDVLRDSFNCDTWTQTDDDGTQITWTIAEMSFSDVGDDTFARKLSAESGGFPFTGDFVAVRDGGFAFIIFHFGIGGVDSELTQSIASDTVDNLSLIETLD